MSIPPKKVHSLTSEQEALLAQIRNEWINIGLSTKPTNVVEAETAIRLCYELANYAQPDEIKWFTNPIDGANWLNANLDRANHSITPKLWYSTGELVRAAIAPEIYAKAEQLIYFPVRRVTWAGHFGDAIRNSIGSPNHRVFGSFDLDYLALYAFFEAIGVPCPKLKGLRMLAQQCSCFWLSEGCAIVVSNPSEVCLDSDNKLHAEGKPAIVYEGFCYYAFHGVRLPEKYGITHPKKWQIQWLIEEENRQLKQVLFQGIGCHRLCQEVPSKTLDSEGKYSLLELELYGIQDGLYDESDEWYEDEEIDRVPLHILKRTDSQDRSSYWIIPSGINFIKGALKSAGEVS